MKKWTFHYRYLNAVYCVLILVIFCIHIPELYQLYVLHDEFGYWANAAYFAGLDWSGIASMSPYYSYGYSFLLVPLLLLFDSPIWAYRAAVCLNAVFYAGSFLLAFSCARRLNKGQNPCVLSTICFFLTLYCNNLLQTNIAWSESFLYFVYWLMFFTLILYRDEKKFRFLIFFGVEAFYLYVIHQRSLGVLIAAVLTILMALAVEKQVRLKKLLPLLGIFLAAGAVAVLLKSNMIGQLWKWEDTVIAGQNDFSGQWAKLAGVFASLGDFANLMRHVCGKVFYLAVASCSLFYWSMVWCFRKIREDGKKKEWADLYLIVFLLLSLAATVGIVSIYTGNAGRIDCVVYGRYIEFLAGPFLLLGCSYLYTRKPAVWEYAVYGGLVILTGLAARKLFLQNSTFTYIMSSGSCLFYDGGLDAFRLRRCIAAALAVGAVVFLAGRLKKNVLWLLGAVAVLGYWGSSSNEALRHEVLSGQRYVRNVSHIAEMLQAVDDHVPIYFVRNENVEEFFNWRVENLQFLLPDRTIQWVGREALPSLTGSLAGDTAQNNYFLVQYRTDNLDLSQYSIVTQAHGLIVMVPAGAALAEQCRAYLESHPYVFTDTMMGSATQSEEYAFDADHVDGFLTFVQDLVLTPGTYRVNMELSADEIENDSLGSADVSYHYGSGILYTQNITAQDVGEDGRLTISFSFVCPEPVTGAEFRFYSLGNAWLKLERLEYWIESFEAGDP